ncbi:MAG: undecaprenyl-diphosphate phosphatase [Planctomycetota bacterium]
MTWWQAAILGVVEGLTEYLPVSSTGHLILTAWLLGLNPDPTLAEAAEIKRAVDAFNIVIQAGAIAAVLGLYRSRVVHMVRGLAGKDEAGLKLAVALIVAFVPAAVLGPVLAGPIKGYLFAPWPVIAALAIGGVLCIAVGRRRKRMEDAATLEIEDVGWRVGLVIGLAQCVAMWPGTSRSMMTIVAALLLGLRAKAAAEFSFLLGLVTLGAATVYDGMNDGHLILEHIGWSNLVVGFVAATISAALAVHWFVGFLTRKGLEPFGWYRLVLAAVMGGLIVGGVMSF